MLWEHKPQESVFIALVLNMVLNQSAHIFAFLNSHKTLHIYLIWHMIKSCVEAYFLYK